MKTKRDSATKEKTRVISIGQITKAGMSRSARFIKTADRLKRSKITIKLEKE